MKKHLFLFIVMIFLASWLETKAIEPEEKEWRNICAGGKGAEWYSSAEARSIADTLMAVQKTNGGWEKNHGYHCLTAEQIELMKSTREGESCLDNEATTIEMRFLALMWKQTADGRYRSSFAKALEMIFDAEKDCGGWSQFWPLRNRNYWDFITFNDNLMLNVMQLLREISLGEGNFDGIVDDDTRRRCREAFERGLDLTLRCQVDDNGVKGAWAAQYDPVDLLPAVARPFELPGMCSYESGALLSWLMKLPDPSPRLQEAITAGIEWLDSHRIKDKTLERYVNDNGQEDSRIVDAPGKSLWGRFIQLGGDSGKAVYEKFFRWLRDQNKKRVHTVDGVTYTYTDEEIARFSYRPDMAYKPLYGIYNDRFPNLYYRFIYNYGDTPPEPDSQGCPAATSLTQDGRINYGFVGNWCRDIIELEYPTWRLDRELVVLGDGMNAFEISEKTFLTADGSTYRFSNGYTVINSGGKGWAPGRMSTVKYSQGVTYTIIPPAGADVRRITFYGYDNYDSDACLRNLDGKDYSVTDYVFPAKDGDTPVFVTHTIDLDPARGDSPINFTLGSKQCCLRIVVYTASGGESSISAARSSESVPTDMRKVIRDGEIVITDGRRTFDIKGNRKI